MPYSASLHPKVSPQKLEARGQVTFLAVLSRPPVHLLLIVHAASSASVWDLRAQQLLASVNPDSTPAALPGSRSGGSRTAPQVGSQVTAATWLGGCTRGDFATGHANGEVLVWALPPGADDEAVDSTSSGVGQRQGQQHQRRQDGSDGGSGGGTRAERPSSDATAGGGSNDAALRSPRLLSRLRATQSAAARPVVSLEFLVTGGKKALLVLGGQQADHPDALTLIPLPRPTEVRGNKVGRMCKALPGGSHSWPTAGWVAYHCQFLTASHLSPTHPCGFRILVLTATVRTWTAATATTATLAAASASVAAPTSTQAHPAQTPAAPLLHGGCPGCAQSGVTAWCRTRGH
jgi:hypothetical protein